MKIYTHIPKNLLYIFRSKGLLSLYALKKQGLLKKVLSMKFNKKYIESLLYDKDIEFDDFVFYHDKKMTYMERNNELSSRGIRFYFDRYNVESDDCYELDLDKLPFGYKIYGVNFFVKNGNLIKIIRPQINKMFKEKKLKDKSILVCSEEGSINFRFFKKVNDNV